MKSEVMTIWPYQLSHITQTKATSQLCLGILFIGITLRKNCCVPFCTKVCVEQGEKISYFWKIKSCLTTGFMQFDETLEKLFK